MGMQRRVKSTTKFSSRGASAKVVTRDTPETTSTVSSLVPASKRKIVYDLTKAKTFIYGAPGFGKSTLAASYPGAWYLASEEGQLYLDVYTPTQIKTWEDFAEVLRYIEKERPLIFGDGTPIKTIVVDTIDIVIQSLCDTVAAQSGEAHILDLKFGRGYDTVAMKLKKVLTGMSRWPYGIVLIGHAKMHNFQTKVQTINKWRSRISPSIFSVIDEWADLMLYCDMDEVVKFNKKGEAVGVTQQRLIHTLNHGGLFKWIISH